jgi:hypothetical protein
MTSSRRAEHYKSLPEALKIYGGIYHKGKEVCMI